ncbi:short-chain fatty acid transporter [Kribbella sandramycini]|uniref:Short-chain fatty acid transporter n=1 Tax=Kribbella sandramycini TaxID=60450 RepID=A0A7Y4L1X9_9ACTN|nr:TIGR00366 family protein [Kribbella sandramycini]MBB6565494.1 short-chain fatty acids transporter [Kribbella sandramycini]NOL41761.1 short-chain fatty acid transporter [Kribbella sandramycini]
MTDHGKHARHEVEGEGPLARVALRFTAFTEKWLPDAFGFVLVGTFVVLLFGLFTGEPLLQRPDDPAATKGFGLVDAWGIGFWSLITFTLQMAMIIIGGYAVATSGPVARLIARLARIPKNPRSAVAFVAAVAMFASYLNWAFSLIFAAILAREVARNVPRADYRALGAMAFLGLGTVWAQGLSGSAALQVASASSSPAPVQEVIKAGGRASGLIPLSDTIFTWQALVATLLVYVVGVVMAWFIAPGAASSRTADDLGIELKPLIGRGSAYNGQREQSEQRRPGDWLEHSPLFTLLIVALGVVYLIRYFDGKSFFSALDLNTVNLILFLLALFLHWRPWRMVRAVRDGVPAAAGVLLQFPLYGGIFGMIAYTGISARLAGWLVQASNQFLFPPLIAIYSCVLGIFVPSGGSKWVIEAPYVLEAANELKVDAGWMVVVYDLGEASANLLQPFWMLPTLAILGLKARDIMGYTFTMFLACFPAALIAVTLLAPHVTG